MDRASDFAAQLNCLNSREEYLAAAGELLSSLFPSELVGHTSIDGITKTVALFAFPARPLKEFAESIADTTTVDNPLFLSCVQDTEPSIWTPLRLSDLISDRELHQTRGYQEVLRPMGIDREIALLVKKPSPLSVCVWTVNRWHQDFTEKEVELSARLQPMLRLLEVAYGGQPDMAQMSCAEEYFLTAREQQILQLLEKGLTGLAIGHLLGISPRTVAKHLEHAYAKLGVSNRIEALNRLRT